MEPLTLSYFYLVWGLGLTLFTDKASAFVRDQIADHETNAIKYYLDQEVRFDIQGAYFETPTDEAVHKEARLSTLTADITAPTGLSDEQKARLARHPKIIRLSRKSKKLAAKIKGLSYTSARASKRAQLYSRKKKVDADLNREKMRMRD